MLEHITADTIETDERIGWIRGPEGRAPSCWQQIPRSLVVVEFP